MNRVRYKKLTRKLFNVCLMMMSLTACANAGQKTGSFCQLYVPVMMEEDTPGLTARRIVYNNRLWEVYCEDF